jgi:hypothetical protein
MHPAKCRRAARWLAPLVVSGIAATCGSLAPAAARAAPIAGLTRLSDLRSVSRWAYPNAPAPVRAHPSSRGRVEGHLRLLTIDDQAELYLALSSMRTASGQAWVKIELPGRPNGKTGWVPRDALGSLHVVRGHILVDRERLRATLFRRGRAIFSAPVGVGKASTITPAGNFYVMEKLRAINGPIYGPFALGTSAYAPSLSEWPGGGIVGIHGTDEPALIPGRPSHGCIRMRNADITRLWAIVSVGTPIEIR